jgi:hypothetical protein
VDIVERGAGDPDAMERDLKEYITEMKNALL